MLILLEGFDRVGKTTYATHLNEKFGYNVIHSPQPYKPYAKYKKEVEGYYKAITDMNCLFHKDIILVCDRFIASEYAYSKVNGDLNKHVVEYLEEIDDLLQDKAIIINLFHNWGDNKGKRHQKAYEDYLKKTKVEYMIHDVIEKGMEALDEFIICSLT